MEDGEINGNVEKNLPMFKKVRKTIMDASLYLYPHQNVMGSILGQDPSPIQVLWKSVQYFFFYSPIFIQIVKFSSNKINECELMDGKSL